MKNMYTNTLSQLNAPFQAIRIDTMDVERLWPGRDTLECQRKTSKNQIWFSILCMNLTYKVTIVTNFCDDGFISQYINFTIANACCTCVLMLLLLPPPPPPPLLLLVYGTTIAHIAGLKTCFRFVVVIHNNNNTSIRSVARSVYAIFFHFRCCCCLCCEWANECVWVPLCQYLFSRYNMHWAWARTHTIYGKNRMWMVKCLEFGTNVYDYLLVQ